MSDFVVGAIQQQVKIYDIPSAYQADIFRFLDLARAREASLVVLPALSSLTLIPPLASRTRLDQLKRKQGRKSGLTGLVGKLWGNAASSRPTELNGLKRELLELLDHHPGELYDAYIDLFSAAALKYQTTIVAGSFYLREAEEALPIHVAYVFGPDGMILGRQEKIHLTAEESSFCQAGEALQAIDTPVGRIGILIQEDALYPECGRILAYNGIEISISLTASPGEAAHNQLRHAFLARLDENGLLGVQSCLVGRNLLDPAGQNLAGRAALLGPFQLSPGGDGIIAAAGKTGAEGFIAGAMSTETLKAYWAQAGLPSRQGMHMAAYQSLVEVYRNGRTLDQAYWNLSGALMSPLLQDDDREVFVE